MVRTTIMAERETLYRFEQLAKQRGKSKAALIREAMLNYLRESEKEEPFENPLLSLIGLAGENATEMKLADGGDEAILSEAWS